MTAEADEFSVQLLDEAKRFLEKASEPEGKDAYLHAALIVAFSALESHINGIAEEMAERQDITLLERSLLSERAVKFSKGEWDLADSQYFRLEDRIAFLLRRYAMRDPASYSWWSELRSGLSRRNKLVHPRDAVDLTCADVERYLTAIVEGLNDLYLAVFGKGHPSYGRGLQATATF